jgi:hypothetical protein
MAENTQQRFANCAKTRRGEHILFRSFGLDVTDRRGTLTRSDVMDQIDMYFPNIRRVNITKNGDEFDINLVGVAE